ncbi:DUF3606 domain-containing protein [Variovorax sp. GT1P44]|uniref:DUF3606 domain-containing protein n=1 Tax=Variovorax sp. GT1P44 TaxID=3443742 RepID=UPI003F44A9A8
MTVDLSHFKPLDPGRVNAQDPVEVQYWCAQFHCSEAALRSALAKVGSHVTAVREQLAAREQAGGRAGR